jgi:pyruvate formate lyase activating enzyme
MIFGGMQKRSTIDFPGLISCVLFTRGCNLDCFYCHNRELLGSGDTVDESEIISFLRKREGLLDGVVISGGEPTLQPDLKDFLKKIRSLNYKIKLDTNGQLPEIVRDICMEGLTDYIAVDVKAKKEDYKRICGFSGFERVSDTLSILFELGVKFEARTTLYPSLELTELKELFSSLPVMPIWRLNYFKMPLLIKDGDAPLLNKDSLTSLKITQARQELRSIQPNLVFD